MGKLYFNEEGKINGQVKYYYENGRIRSQDEFENGNQIGRWENYNTDGELTEYEFYNQEGELTKTEKVK